MQNATLASVADSGSEHSEVASQRRQLLGEHLGLVYHVARQLCRAKQIDAELDELVSAGTIGLIEAFNNFDGSRGLAFSTFAAPRIRGAILDELRRQDPLPRSVRRRSREIVAATQGLTSELGRSPDQQMIADRMGVDVATLFRWQSEADPGRFISIDRSVNDGNLSSRMPDAQLVSATADDIEERLTREQEVLQLRRALAELPKQERDVLSLYYFEELKLHEIAALLGVSESRISQIRTKAITRLRSRLGALRCEVA